MKFPQLRIGTYRSLYNKDYTYKSIIANTDERTLGYRAKVEG